MLLAREGREELFINKFQIVLKRYFANQNYGEINQYRKWRGARGQGK